MEDPKNTPINRTLLWPLRPLFVSLEKRARLGDDVRGRVLSAVSHYDYSGNTQASGKQSRKSGSKKKAATGNANTVTH